jgi:hypothetical protein
MNTRIHKNNMIYILTKDNMYYVKDKKVLNGMTFFKRKMIKSKGRLSNPFFLQKIKSSELQILYSYLEYYQVNEDDTILHDYYCILSDWDENFFNNIKDEEIDNIINASRILGMNEDFDKKITYYKKHTK